MTENEGFKIEVELPKEKNIEKTTSDKRKEAQQKRREREKGKPKVTAKSTETELKNDAKFMRGILQAVCSPDSVTKEQIEAGEIPIMNVDTLYDVWEQSLYATMKKYNYEIPPEALLLGTTAMIVMPTAAQLYKYHNIGQKLGLWKNKTLAQSKKKKGFLHKWFGEKEEGSKHDTK